METPAKTLKMLPAKAVSIALGRRGVIGTSVALDSEDETAWLFPIFERKVDRESRCAPLRPERDCKRSDNPRYV